MAVRRPSRRRPPRPRGVQRARLGQQRQRRATMFVRAHAAVDPADVRRGLLVEPAVAHRGDRARGGDDRAAPVLGTDAGVGGAAAELGARCGSRSARRRRSRRSAWRGRRRSRTRRAAGRRRTPWRRRARSPRDGEQQLDADRRALDAARRPPSITATAALLSAPRIAVVARSPSRRRRSPARSAPPAATVSRCAHSRTVRGPTRPGMRASRLPHSAPVAAAASSSSTSRPIAAQLGGDGLRARRARGRTGSGSRTAARTCRSAGRARPRRPASRAAQRPSARRPLAARVTAHAATLDRGLHGGRAPGALAALAQRAPTNSRNSGAGRSGRDLNSGWNCEATKNGWSASSMISTRRSSGDVPETTRPAFSSRRRRKLLTS